MRILWFTNTSSLYEQGNHHYNGCGWIESLEALLRENKNLDLGVSFFHFADNKKTMRNGTVYYPILQKRGRQNPLKKLISNWTGQIEFPELRVDIEKIIRDFNPDLIQVFGTEGAFSEVQNYTEIPVIYHIQGLINPYMNTYLPINQSKNSFHLSLNYAANTIKGNNPAFDLKRFKYQAVRERKVLGSARFVSGRTHWDKMLVELFNPKIKYFHIDEVLRQTFYDSIQPKKEKKLKYLKIISTLSPTVYKGIDVILKTAKQLKELTNINFQWEIIGLESSEKLFKHFEKSENVNHQEVNIVCRGRKNAEELKTLLQKADVYVHPSYIDNSPNSVCEAQMLGLPVIACDVGGVSSLIQHGETGFLIPSNGVFELVHHLIMLNENPSLRKTIGTKSCELANLRHNPIKIGNDLILAYQEIIKNKDYSRFTIKQ